jgi:hypothetical protein
MIVCVWGGYTLNLQYTYSDYATSRGRFWCYTIGDLPSTQGLDKEKHVWKFVLVVLFIFRMLLNLIMALKTTLPFLGCIGSDGI